MFQAPMSNASRWYVWLLMALTNHCSTALTNPIPKKTWFTVVGGWDEFWSKPVQTLVNVSEQWSQWSLQNLRDRKNSVWWLHLQHTNSKAVLPSIMSPWLSAVIYKVGSSNICLLVKFHHEYYVSIINHQKLSWMFTSLAITKQLYII